MTNNSGPNPSGLCMCGCGGKTSLSKLTRKERGDVRGKPVRFLPSHHMRINNPNRRYDPQYAIEDRGYTSPCWVWLWSIDAYGYGQVGHDGQPRRAHRVYYQARYGPIPEGLQIDHLCRVRACVNPDHLEVVTAAENSRRSAIAKLNIEKVKALRKRYATNKVSYKDLAAEYGVHPSTIRHAITGRRWKF